MKAIKFIEKILIDEAPQAVFDYTQDYDNRLSWDTFLKKAELINGATEASKGVKAYCVARNGLAMETEYITYDRPKVTAVKMTKGPFLFTSFLGSWTFRDVGCHKTEVTFLYSFGLRFPFNFFSFLIRNILQKDVRNRLVDLKNNIEKKSGQ